MGYAAHEIIDLISKRCTLRMWIHEFITNRQLFIARNGSASSGTLSVPFQWAGGSDEYLRFVKKSKISFFGEISENFVKSF